MTTGLLISPPTATIQPRDFSSATSCKTKATGRTASIRTAGTAAATTQRTTLLPLVFGRQCSSRWIAASNWSSTACTRHRRHSLSICNCLPTDDERESNNSSNSSSSSSGQDENKLLGFSSAWLTRFTNPRIDDPGLPIAGRYNVCYVSLRACLLVHFIVLTTSPVKELVLLSFESKF